MESNIEDQILMWDQIASFGDNGEIFAAEFGVPLEFGAHIAEVRQLHGLGYLRVGDNRPETNCVFHQFHLDSMGGHVHIQQFLLLLVVDNFVEEFGLEGTHSCGWLERYLDVIFFTWLDDNVVDGGHIHEHLLELLQLSIHIEGNLNLLAGVVDESDLSDHILANFGDPEIYILIFSAFDFQFQRDSFSFDLDVDFIQTVDIEGEVFLVVLQISRGEDDRDLEDVLFESFKHSFFVLDLGNFVRKHDFSFGDLDVQVIGLFVK